MKTIAIVNQKGGVGKTTTTLNLSAALAERSRRVLAIDLDPQGSLTAALFPDPFEKTIYHVFKGLAKIKDIIANRGPFDVVPADIELSGIELQTGLDAYFKIRDELESVSGYDYILIDCPPALNLFMVNAVMAANQIIIAVQTEHLALKGFSHLLDTLATLEKHNPAIKKKAAVFTMVDNRRKLDQSIKAAVQELDLPTFQAEIRKGVELAEASIKCQTIFEYSPNSKGTSDYRSLAAEIERF